MNNTNNNTTNQPRKNTTPNTTSRNTTPVKKTSFNKGQIVALCVIGLSCLAVVSGFVYSYYNEGGGSLFGSSNTTDGSALTGSNFEVADEDITDYVDSDTLLEWTQEAEDTLEEYVADEEEVPTEEETNSESTGDTSSNSSSNNSNSSNNNSSSNSDSSTETPAPSDTLGKGEWLAKYYDGGVMRYYGDGSVYDMTRNVWWTKTQWNDFMASITQ